LCSGADPLFFFLSPLLLNTDLLLPGDVTFAAPELHRLLLYFISSFSEQFRRSCRQVLSQSASVLFASVISDSLVFSCVLMW
jgi:hypothetical protein